MDFPHAHLIAHTALYAVLYYLGYRALKHQQYSSFVSEFSPIITLFIVMLYGASDEFHQSFVPGRTEEFKDFAIDVGAALVVLIIVLMKDKFRSNKRKLDFSSKEE